MKFLALDFETSGTDPNENAPVSLGVAFFEDATVIDSSEWLIQPPTHYKDKSKIMRAYDERARLIHGYTLEYLIEHGQSAAEVCSEFGAFVKEHNAGNNPIVAFNANFDWSFFNTLLFLAGSYDRNTQAFMPCLSPISGPWQCAMQLAQRRLPRLENYKLATVAPFLKVGEQGDVHGARADAILAGLVFAKLRQVEVAA